MAGKLFTIALSHTEISHLLTLIADNEREGWYYGPRGTYKARSARIVEKLVEASSSRGQDHERLADREAAERNVGRGRGR